ncbi:DUF2157 domain-containing protein [Pseudomonas sp. NCCP-436]|uniref:DUF2157 domain-containing protein n=1 Tax=Pseudomonas sp. NCCP-436 TaxID=2842481 RepID=UPI001C80EEF2|nr:DUF2157 domain-containing protein [Pseudomonas sp. NCCP-436]GIZ13142.1 hypothetical protein NCCP436_25580 [Pseudomonas sp. NCCP-436]
MSDLPREQAQRRAERVAAFRQELAELQQEQVLSLSDVQQKALHEYHERLLCHYRQNLDIDADDRARQLSLGMRLASLFGALALAAGLFFLFHRFWGLFDTPVQVGLLMGSSLGSLWLCFWLQRRDSTGYYSGLAAVLALVCFVLNLTMLGQIFNIAPSDKALLPWGAMALLLAYQCRWRILLVSALLCFGLFIAARVSALSGWHWSEMGERLENFMPAVLLSLIPLLFGQARYPGFAACYRIIGLLFLLVPVLLLGYWGEGSYLGWPTRWVEVFYQVLGFGLAGLVIWLGIDRGWREVTTCGTGYALVLLLCKLFDWWWELLPRYLFFLLIGLIALLLLVILQRWRRDAQGGAA